MNKKIKYILSFFFLLTFFFSFYYIVSAASVSELLISSGKSANYKTEGRELYMVLAVIIKTFLSLLGMFFMALSIYAGFIWMNAKGDTTRVTKAKDILQHALIGIAIVFGAYAITYFVVSMIAKEVTIGSGFN